MAKFGILRPLGVRPKLSLPGVYLSERGCGVFLSLLFRKQKTSEPSQRCECLVLPGCSKTAFGLLVGTEAKPLSIAMDRVHGWPALPAVDEKQIDQALDFEGSFQPEKPSKEIPFPNFRTRARVKQLWSSVIASIPTQHLTIKILKDFRVEGFDPALRDDGGGEADPDHLGRVGGGLHA